MPKSLLSHGKLTGKLPFMQLPPRLESLVLKNGLHLGLLSESDRTLMLALAACTIEPRRSLRENEVNQCLADWLTDVGAMVHTDHVELRRWLVDSGYVSRDGWGHAYFRGPAQIDKTQKILGMTDRVALASAVRAVRVAAQSARLTKRRAFESQSA